MRIRTGLTAAGVAACLAAPTIAAQDRAQAGLRTDPAPVVVATFDTGTNPFHPCFRRDWQGARSPRRFVPGYPRNATALPLSFASEYAASLAANRPLLDQIQEKKLYFVPGTNLSFYGEGNNAKDQFVDDYTHGAQASSQIACDKYGMAPNAHLVVLNWYDSARKTEMMLWVAEQPWIDVVHLNIQDLPYPVTGPMPDAIRSLIASGKMVVIAGGNGVYGQGASYPMEISRWNGPPGSLIAGANDNGGYTSFSNLDPHVVMDGGATRAAAGDSFGEAPFGGTSSASPRISGYVARVIGELRSAVGHSGVGLVTIPEGAPVPTTGPLADGSLSAPELHEAVRKTANPNPHESMYDGGLSIYIVPQPVDLPFAFYPKMGYGEVSEHTIEATIDVLLGRRPFPDRPNEDRFYEQSESLRHRLWG